MKVILKGINKVEVEIDKKFYKEVMNHSWYNNRGYCVANITINKQTRKVYLHRFIMELAGYNCKGKMLDHKNRNRGDNRLINLRFCSASNNLSNSRPNPKIYSGYRGVCYCKEKHRQKRWLASCCVKRKTIHIGRYATEVEAALAYNNKAREIHGAFAYQNIV